MRSLLDILDLSKKELDDLVETAEDIIDNPEKYSESCKGKILATLFFEPSTRTRLSFESAMLKLGGGVISMPGSSLSSATKGESVADTAHMVSSYADIIAMRHPKEGAAQVLADNASVPVINAGDGGHWHPTQTLGDLLTIHREKGRYDNLTIGLCGDLKYGRTVHSLINALSRYEGVNFVLISPDELKLPRYVITEVIEKNGLKYKETSSLEEALPELDILYMTRIQRERFDTDESYESLKNSYILDVEKMKLAKDNCSVLHPLPRVNEISVKVDSDPRACYFKQALYGRYMRMALILKLLNDDSNVKEKEYVYGMKCNNPRCITSCEQELEHRFVLGADGKTYRCAYCEKDI